MSIFSEEKYSPTRICEECFRTLDMSFSRCPDCRRSALCDSVEAVGRAKVRYALWCFAFGAMPLVGIAGYVWQAGINTALNSNIVPFLSGAALMLFGKGLAFFIFGKRIIRTERLDDDENKIFFVVEMAGIVFGILAIVIWIVGRD